MAKGVKSIPEQLLAYYCTYEESSNGHGSFIAEVSFCPSNSEYKKVVLEQYAKRNIQLQCSVPFDVADGDELYISSIDLSNVKDNEWIIIQLGRLTITCFHDFEYWEIFRGLTVDQIREREESFEYPPRLQIRCEQIDDTKSLYFSFKVSKRSKNREMPIAKFSLIKKVSASPDTTSTVQATATLPSNSASKNQNEILKEINDCPDDKYLNKYVRGKVCAAGANKWWDLGIMLMGQDAVTDLDVIRINHPNDVEECCSRMFTKWRQTTPKASWKQLIEALKEIKLNQLSSELEKLLQPAELEEQSALVTSERQQSLKHFKVASTVQTAAPLPYTGASENQNEILKRKPCMIELTKIVIPRIMIQWEYIAEALHYDIAAIENIKQQRGCEGPKQCSREFFKDWLTTNNGIRAGPKVWSTLINALKEVDEISTDIVEDIVKEVLQLKCD